ncbi:MAG: tetratricopeptide repeat protein [Proteobacteria bacterium]|nr:tetratricopeptide repeat protein [Pseudomonadota bacterium]
MRTTIQKAAKIALVFVFLLAASKTAAADLLTSENGDVAEGNELLAEGKIAEALGSYEAAARSLPGRHGVHLNRGLALSRMGDEQIDQAMQALTLASEGGGSDEVRARALANLGNAFQKKEDFPKALELYKKSLMLIPGNKDVAWNLELAMRKKKEQEEQQKEQQDKQDQENQDQQNQDQQDQQDQNQQDQQNQDQKKEDQEKKEQEKKDQGDQQQQQEQEKKEQPQPQPKTKQEVEQVLDSLENQKESLMKQMARQKGAMVPAGRFKDW